MAKTKEAHKEKKKGKKKGWFSGFSGFLGNTDETKGNVKETAQQGVVTILAVFAGGLAGAAIGGAGALYGGIGAVLGGLFSGSEALANAGAGMMIGSAVKPTPVQNANLQNKNAEADMPIDKTRNQLATGASAFLQNMKDNSMVNKVLPKAKEPAKPTTPTKTEIVPTKEPVKTEIAPEVKTNVAGLGMIGPRGSFDASRFGNLGNTPDYQKAYDTKGIRDTPFRFSM